jgi:hypothetical protein
MPLCEAQYIAQICKDYWWLWFNRRPREEGIREILLDKFVRKLMLMRCTMHKNMQCRFSGTGIAEILEWRV